VKVDFDLLSAVLRGGLDDVVRALREGAAPDALDSSGWSALMWAAGQGDVGKLRALLDRDADPFVRDGDGRTAYAVAAAAGRLAAMELLGEAEQRRDPAKAADSSGRHASRPYCRAYSVSRLAVFKGWPASARVVGEPASAAAAGGEAELLFFVHRSLRVTRSVFADAEAVLRGDEPGWADFCRDELGFRPVDDRDWAIAMSSLDGSDKTSQ
jgi:hypothetical protein